MLRALSLLLLLSSLALPLNSTQTEGDETQIIAFENLWNQMQIAHDADAMDQLLDPISSSPTTTAPSRAKPNSSPPFAISPISSPSKSLRT